MADIKFSASYPKGINKANTTEFSRVDSDKFVKHILRQVKLKAIIRPVFLDLENDDFNNFKPEAKANLRNRITRLAKTQQRIYESHLNGLVKVLDNGIENIHNIAIPISTSKGVKESATASLGWKPLSKETRKIKASNPKFSKNYWRHTGRLARAFKSAVSNQKKGLHSGNFVKVSEAVRALDNSPVFLDDVEGKFHFQFTLNVLTPKWKGKEAQLMDTLITDPYVGNKNRTVLSNAVGKVQKKREQIQLAFKQEEEAIQKQIDALNKNRTLKGEARKELRVRLVHRLIELQRKQEVSRHQYRMESIDKLTEHNTGLRRLILPEHNRPFIQKLSKYSGNLARADLKNMA
jgi:hypothetical protein